MSRLALEALALAERHNILIGVVGGDRLSWESRGRTPGRALRALRAAKGELIDLLTRYQLDSTGALAGDGLLAALQVGSFAVRRYGVNAALDNALAGALDRVPATSLLHAFADRQAEYGLALRALRAPDRLTRHREPDRADKPDKSETAGTRDTVAEARHLVDKLRGFGFKAYLDQGAPYFADVTGWRRDLFKLISPTLVFEVLNAGLDDDPALLDPRENSP
jgi:hypothetical protein